MSLLKHKGIDMTGARLKSFLDFMLCSLTYKVFGVDRHSQNRENQDESCEDLAKQPVDNSYLQGY